MPADPNDTLQIEARIIQEDATLAAIVLRVDKVGLRDFLQRNAPFFAAVTDLSPALVPATLPRD